MNRYKNSLFKSIFFLTVLLTTTIVGFCQDSKKDKEAAKRAEIENLINSGNFVFVAQYVIPTGGRSMYLTSEYTLDVTKQNVTADLPFFGRAYVAPIDPTEGGIKFTSTSFDYNIKNAKKGGWNVTIVPKDDREVRQMYLSVMSDGSSTLQVINNNKQPIAFNGYIKAGKTK